MAIGLGPVTTALAPPPGPVGERDMRSIRDDPLAFLDGLRAAYGDISLHRVDGAPVVVVSSPQLARTVLRERYDTYVKTGTPDEFMLRPLLGNGLLTSDGVTWARQRRACAPAFRPATIEQFAPLMTAAAQRLATRWTDAATAAAAAGGPAPRVRVDHDLMGLTLAVVASAMLGADLTGVGPGFGEAVDAVNRYLGHVVPGQQPAPDDAALRDGFLRGRAFLEMLARTLVSARRLGGPPAQVDLLAVLLGGGPDDAQAADDTELRDQVLTMVMAGHETTAKSLTWALHLLAGHPAELELLTREVDEVLDGRPATAQDLSALVRVRAVLLESLRLYPPVWLISRRCLRDDVLAGHTVPADALVCVSPWVLHRRADLWPQPAEFHPERFLAGCAAQAQAHSYLPFGGGPRTCIGEHFATMEAVLVLATLVQRVRLTGLPGHPVVPEALVTLRPRDGLLMTAAARS